MFIDGFLIFYIMLFIIGIMLAILYGSLGVGLLITATTLIAISFQQVSITAINTLRFIAVLLYLASVFFIYRAWVSARFKEYSERIQYEPVNRPNDPIAVLLDKIIKWLKDP